MSSESPCPDEILSKAPRPPRRSTWAPDWRALISGAATAFAATGGFICVMSLTVTHTSGATRSTRIRWQQRAAEIDRAIAAETTEVRHE